ncbi:hypothetical protein K432DRAFT_387350 [Lepidopterella palustris CBS 459.81]|uniref:Uncharacterized protein n=1 Tax=Lepidopterella palustris CBS 459.81 TaxID=1314670 RepID=A0A8E2DXI7_9PEZI|nr:hypothetical protein K432DRAFT_387350 [Lepidopterella palustris CBS 459.81]
MFWRAVMFWVRLVFRIVFWGSLVLAGVWVWNRGVDDAVQDAQSAVAYWVGYWQEQRVVYEQQVELAKRFGAAGMREAGGWGGRRGREGWR